MPDPGVRPGTETSQAYGSTRAPANANDTSNNQSSSTGIVFADEEEEDSLQSLQEQYFDEFGTTMPWQEMIYSRLPDDVMAWAKQIGEDPFFVGHWLAGIMPNIIGYVDNQINASPELRKANPIYRNGFINSPEGFEYIYGLALGYIRSRDARFADMVGGAGSSGRGRGRGGGRGGGGGPSAADIRKQFDLDELTNMVNDIWFGNVLTEAPDARGIARSYVDAIVNTRGEQRIDFATFVRKQVEATTRYKQIYSRKPKGMSAEQFLQPLFQVASQIAGPEEAEGLAVGAAQFGGDPNAFRERLQRTDSVRNSAPFMQSMEQRFNNLNKVFKG